MNNKSSQIPSTNVHNLSPTAKHQSNSKSTLNENLIVSFNKSKKKNLKINQNVLSSKKNTNSETHSKYKETNQNKSFAETAFRTLIIPQN